MMFKEAEARGATIMQGVATSALRNVDGSLRGIMMRRPEGTEEEIETRVVLDCSGQNFATLRSLDALIASKSQVGGKI